MDLLFRDTTAFIYLIPVVVSFCIFLSYLKFRKLANPISFISVWWGGWLLIANFSLTGLFVPGVHTQLLIILMIVAYSLGALAANKEKEKNDKILKRRSILFNQRFDFALKKLYPILFILILPLFIKAVLLFQSLSILDLDGYRTKVFGTADEPSILYGSFQLLLVYQALVYAPLLLVLIVSSIFLYFFGNKLYFILSLILIFLKSIMELGRTEIYSIFVLLSILSILFNKQISDKINSSLESLGVKSIKKLRFFLGSFLLVIIVVVAIISFTRRTESQGEDIFGVFYDFAIWYHTTGFILLDFQVDNPASVLSQNITYGLSTISGLELPLFLIFTRFNKDFSGFLPMIVGGKEKTISDLNAFMDDFQQVGPDTFSNAYYTMVYPFYQDGREIGVFIMSFILGFATSLFYQDWSKNNNFYSLTWLLLFLYMTFLSLFQYYFGSLACLMAMLLLFLVQTFRRSTKLTDPAL